MQSNCRRTQAALKAWASSGRRSEVGSAGLKLRSLEAIVRVA
jgi:hypothetical protein